MITRNVKLLTTHFCVLIEHHVMLTVKLGNVNNHLVV